MQAGQDRYQEGTRERESNQELEEAIRTNREDAAQRISFQMAGNGLGPRKRKHYVLPDARLGQQTWTLDLVLPGSEGGAEAIMTTAEGFIRDASAHDCPFRPDMEHWELANHDLVGVAHQLGRGRRRRAAPPWSMPTE
eukprot:7637366-Pyramimonas_sp.AAC.1